MVGDRHIQSNRFGHPEGEEMDGFCYLCGKRLDDNDPGHSVFAWEYEPEPPMDYECTCDFLIPDLLCEMCFTKVRIHRADGR